MSCFIFHNYGNWQNVETGDVYQHINGTERMVATYIKQVKYCKKCNKLKMRKIEI